MSMSPNPPRSPHLAPGATGAGPSGAPHPAPATAQSPEPDTWTLSPSRSRARSPSLASLAPIRLPETGVEIDHDLELERAASRASRASGRTAHSRVSSRAADPIPHDGDAGASSAGTATTLGDGADGADAEAQQEPDIYSRFSPHRKHLMIAIVAFSGFLGPVASSAFLPSIGVMADELHTTPEMINYTVAIFIVTIGAAPLFWSPLSGFYGRRPIYLLSMPIMTVGSIGVANSHSIGALIGTRIVQGIGSSSVLAVGAGTVGDLYKPTERANAMSWFYSGIVIGPAVSPVIAGIFTQYTALTWRSTQYFICGCSALSVALTALFLPETSHPPLPHSRIRKERGKKFVPYWFNPIRSVLLLRYPNIAAITLTSCLIMVELYCIMIPLSTVFKDRYHLNNVALAGCIYLANGLGTIIGARVTGPYADKIVLKWIEKRGYRKPEDRLRSALIGTGIVLPGSCREYITRAGVLTTVAYGWLLWGDKGGMAPPIVMLVINGLGTQSFFTPINTYLVDCMQKRSAEAIAVNNFFRYLFAAAASAFVLPLINATGLGVTMTIGAVCVWIALGLVLLVIRFGEGWRHKAAGTEVPTAQPKTEQSEEKASMDEKPAVASDEKSHADDDAVSLAEKPASHKASRRQSEASDHSHHEERAHGEPSHLPTVAPRPRRGTSSAGAVGTSGNAAGPGAGQTGTAPGLLGRQRSRRSSTTSLPTVGEVLQRTASLSGASVH